MYPKEHIEKLRLRNHAIGRERRLNMAKIILEHGTPVCLPVTYEDVDKTFFEWVDKKIDIAYNGKKLPTYKLFSNQKLSEYSQTWSNLDETGNIIMNFKTITRENNPQHGESQGGNYNVPGNRDYPMFYVPVLQENGEEAYDLYSMKQPLSVNFMYTVSVICNKYEILNKFNETIQYEFSALECYISPNGHPMPMVIENITDESEYNIDDRKYYAQSYQIKLMAYIIRGEDFKVTKIPSRYTIKINNIEKTNKKNNINNCWLGKVNDIFEVKKEDKKQELPKLEHLSAFEVCEKPLDLPAPHRTPSVSIEDIPECCKTKEKDPYVHKTMKLIADFPYCEEHTVTFTMDAVIDIDTIETKNVHDFVIKINGKVQTFEDEVKLLVGDEVFINISREDEYGDSSLTIVGTDPETVIDTRIEYESVLDEPIKEEDIYISELPTN